MGSSTHETTPSGDSPDEKKLTELQETFLREIDEVGASAHTIRNYRQTFIHINRAGLELADFDRPELLEKFAHALPARFERSTILAYLARCARFGNWLALCHYTTRRHRAPDRPRRPKRREVMTEEETAALLESLRLRAMRADFFRQTYERDWLIVCVLYETGARISEALDLCVDDLHNREEGNYLVIRGTKTEDSERAVEISDELFINLTRYRHQHAIARGRIFRTRSGKKVDRVTFGHWLKKYVRNLDIQCPVTPHLFRYQYIMREIAKGTSALEVMTRLGHGGVDMTVYYFNQVRRLMPWVKTNPDVSILERRIAHWKKRNHGRGGESR